MGTVHIRTILDGEDVEAIIAIERRISGSTYRTTAFEEDAATYLQQGESHDHLVAVVDDRVVGFIIGKTAGLEFGQEERVGWINILGVDPDFRGRGIGQALGKALLDNFRNKNVAKVKTLVGGQATELLQYFQGLGLKQSNMRVLEITL